MVCYPSSVRMHTEWRRGKNLWSYDPGPGWLPQRFLVENGKSVFPGNWLLIYRCFGAHLQIFVTKMGDFPFHLVHLIHELTVFLNEALPLVCELNRWKILTLTKSYWKMRVRFQSSKRGFGSYKEPLREAELNTAESQDMVRMPVRVCMRVRVVDLRLQMRRSKESGSKRDGGRQLRSFGSIPPGGGGRTPSINLQITRRSARAVRCIVWVLCFQHLQLQNPLRYEKVALKER